MYSFICTYIRTSSASSPARWRCSTTLANSPAFASQLERWMEACAWRQPSMSSSRCTLYNHHHYHHILQLPLLPPLACVVTTILLLPLPPKLSHIAWVVTTASTTTATTTITHLWLSGLVEIAVGVCSSVDSLLRHIHATADTGATRVPGLEWWWAYRSDSGHNWQSIAELASERFEVHSNSNSNSNFMVKVVLIGVTVLPIICAEDARNKYCR